MRNVMKYTTAVNEINWNATRDIDENQMMKDWVYLCTGPKSAEKWEQWNAIQVIRVCNKQVRFPNLPLESMFIWTKPRVKGYYILWIICYILLIICYILSMICYVLPMICYASFPRWSAQMARFTTVTKTCESGLELRQAAAKVKGCNLFPREIGAMLKSRVSCGVVTSKGSFELWRSVDVRKCNLSFVSSTISPSSSTPCHDQTIHARTMKCSVM